MKIIISYDISSIYQRKKLSDFLLAEGFYRIQKSIFIGNYNFKKITKKIEKLELILDRDKDSILYCPLCEKDLKKMISLGKVKNLKKLDILPDFLLY